MRAKKLLLLSKVQMQVLQKALQLLPVHGKVQVQPVCTAEYGLSKAARPFNSRLDKSKLQEKGFAPLPDWRDALSRYRKEIETEG